MAMMQAHGRADLRRSDGSKGLIRDHAIRSTSGEGGGRSKETMSATVEAEFDSEDMGSDGVK